MPRIFTIEMADEFDDEKFNDEEFDPLAAAPEAFQYVPAPAFGPKGPVYVAVNPSQVGKIDNGPDAVERELGRISRPQNDWEVQAEGEAARFAAALLALGALRAYVRYDGGNDEGFAWFDRCAMADGSTRDADQVAKDLEAAGVKPAIQTWGNGTPTRNALDDILANPWAGKLLGEGYGTGEYVMYGACWVDLKSGLISDDADPAPVAQNFQFKGQ
jgi:hypothetical protein